MSARGLWGIAMPRLAFAVLPLFLAIAGAASAFAASGAVAQPRQDRLLVAQAAMGNFYLYEFEQQSGPYSAEELIEQISIGNIGKSAFVWQPGMDDWAPIESIPDFAAAFAPEIELPRPYYVIEDGMRIGPLTETEMQIRIIELLSGAGDLAWKAGLDDWTPLSEFPEFADQLAAAQVPELPGQPGEDEPPPLPGDEDHAGEDGARLGDVELAALWTELEAVLTRQVPVLVGTATPKEQQQIIVCLGDLLRPADPGVWRLLIDAELQPDEAQAAVLNKLDPSLTAAAQACIDEATGMKDMLDAMLFGAADEAFTGAPSELLLEAYKCLRESVEAVSPEHRQEVMNATDRLDDSAIAILEDHYPGFAARVQGCLIADLAPHDDGGDDGAILVVPPVDDGGEDEAMPIVPPVEDDGAGGEDVTVGGPDEPETPIDEPEAPAAITFLEAIKRSLAQGGMPAYLVSTTAPCFAGRLERVITDAERQAIIAEGLTDAISQQLETAHPGLGESLAGCVPQNVF
jgi:hypothetical protein